MFIKYRRSALAEQEFAAYDEVLASAAIAIDGETVYTNELEDAVYEGLETCFEGSVTLAGEDGILAADGAFGLKIEGETLTNGIAIDLDSENDTFMVGGEDTYYTVNGKSYNSVIKVDSGDGNERKGYEAAYGVGVAINEGELWVRNSYIKSESTRSTPIYALSTNDTSVVVVDSHLEAHSSEVWMPSFKLLYGGARATILMSQNNSWFYGSDIVANTWGAISQDAIDASTYVVNSAIKTTEGGYGSYQTYNLYLYGSKMYAAQYGIFMCGTSYVLTDTGAAGKADGGGMMLKVSDYVVDEGASTIVVAPTNAVAVHTSLPYDDQVASGDFKDSILSTLEADLPEDVKALSYADGFFFPGINPNGDACGQAYFFIRNLFGAVVLIRSMNADLIFDNTEMRSSSGILFQSVITYDPPDASGYLASGDTVNSGILATFKNRMYTGDILHEDYQRQMTVTLDGSAVLEGRVVSGTVASWNEKWSDENLLAAVAEDNIDTSGFGEDWKELVRTELIQNSVDENYDCKGVSMVIKDGAKWIITGTSSLSGLTIEEGATIVSGIGNLDVFVTVNGVETSIDAGTYIGEIVLSLARTPSDSSIAETNKGII